ncbi:hypothetical protein [Streptomyces umbrinus]|uniref:hypothetical protein n=1 Tax=Streptomyces umbrinus TaxID=67370 RepID=UPI0033E92B20
MDIQLLTVWIRARAEQLRTARDRGATSTELAVLTGALLLGAGLFVTVMRAKLLEKIGIVEGG